MIRVIMIVSKSIRGVLLYAIDARIVIHIVVRKDGTWERMDIVKIEAKWRKG